MLKFSPQNKISGVFWCFIEIYCDISFSTIHRSYLTAGVKENCIYIC